MGHSAIADKTLKSFKNVIFGDMSLHDKVRYSFREAHHGPTATLGSQLWFAIPEKWVDGSTTYVTSPGIPGKFVLDPGHETKLT